MLEPATYAGADSRSGTSSAEEDDFDAESEEASEAASDEVSSPGGSPGGAANASVYERGTRQRPWRTSWRYAEACTRGLMVCRRDWFRTD